MTMQKPSNNNNNETVHLVVQRYRSCKVLLEEKKWVRVGFDDADTSIDDNGNSSGEIGEAEGVEINKASLSSPASVSPLSQHKQRHCGLLVYVSFASMADDLSMEQAVTTILNLPVLTTGLWGDGVSSTVSILQLLSSSLSPTTAASTSVTIIPQANIICKVKGQGKSIQYHGQIEKMEGRRLYQYFCDYLRGVVLEHQCSCTNKIANNDKTNNNIDNSLPEWYCQWKCHHTNSKSNNRKTAGTSAGSPPSSYDPGTPPHQLFRDPSRYAAWDDETGLPVTDVSGQPVTKSALKKLRKIQDAHQKKHRKWKDDHPQTEQQEKTSKDNQNSREETANPRLEVGMNDSESGIMPTKTEGDAAVAQKPQQQEPSEDQWSACLDPSFCQVVVGSFGKRQGLEMRSDMGPFCHLLQI